jgi:putative membrane protein
MRGGNMDKKSRIALIVVGVVIGLFIIMSTVMGIISGGTEQGWGMMGGNVMGVFGWWFMPVFMVIVWGLIIWGVIALVHSLSHPETGASGHPESALEILRKRYARGEISKEQYEQMKKDLS